MWVGQVGPCSKSDEGVSDTTAERGRLNPRLLNFRVVWFNMFELFALQAVKCSATSSSAASICFWLIGGCPLVFPVLKTAGASRSANSCSNLLLSVLRSRSVSTGFIACTSFLGTSWPLPALQNTGCTILPSFCRASWRFFSILACTSGERLLLRERLWLLLFSVFLLWSESVTVGGVLTYACLLTPLDTCNDFIDGEEAELASLASGQKRAKCPTRWHTKHLSPVGQSFFVCPSALQ